MFREGEWVITPTGKLGWIVSHAREINVRIYVLDEMEGRNEQWVSRRHIVSYEGITPEAKEDAKPVLVEMALMTKDENLFWEVTAG